MISYIYIIFVLRAIGLLGDYLVYPWYPYLLYPTPWYPRIPTYATLEQLVILT